VVPHRHGTGADVPEQAQWLPTLAREVVFIISSSILVLLGIDITLLAGASSEKRSSSAFSTSSSSPFAIEPSDRRK